MKNSLWKALKVRPRFERIVALRLQQQGIEHCLPMYRVPRASLKGTQIELPLFPGYVFCTCKISIYESILRIPGALAVVPADAIPTQEIEDLQKVINSGLSYGPWPFAMGRRLLTIEDGPLTGITGSLADTPDGRLIFSVPSIRRSVAIQVDYTNKLWFSESFGS